MFSSRKCQTIHWLRGHKEKCQTLNESVIAATRLTPQQTPHIHGGETKQSGSLDDKSNKQSSTLTDA